ncbi:MAG: DUF853 family protein [Deltaproteobacteria bacterium]|nr:MAG: DUF853 family protein [Deltaproteobacteria bacterium]
MAMFLGREFDLETGAPTGADVTFKADRLTSHAVCLGMTGSGKTGMCVVLLEELALQGVPLIVIDPKGDMANLALAFGDLAPSSFAPWVDPSVAERAGMSVGDYATRTAEKWKQGLAGWGITPERVSEYQQRAEVRVFTPGSTSGIPVDVLGSFAVPEGVDAESRADLAAGTVSALLGLLGREVDPVTDPEHIVLTKVIDAAWEAGESLTVEGLLPRLVDPPFGKVGVFSVDQFLPRDKRMKLAMTLNGVLAAPGFQTWAQGVPLEPDTLVNAEGGRTPVNIFSLAHLDETERQFFVGQLLHRLVSWSRRQPGSSQLRALLYFDEVFGFVPPYPRNPPAKKPILTLMKQARAVGLGTMLVTQNPVDVDYATLSNAGLWLVGRLHTAQDRAKVVEGLAASGASDEGQVSAWLEDLKPRVFVMRDVREEAPKLVHSRWAMSWLRGPLTRREIEKLPQPDLAAKAPRGAAGVQTGGEPVPSGFSASPPVMPGGLTVRFLDPEVAFSAELAPSLGHRTVQARSDGKTLWEPALYAELQLRFDEGTQFVHDEVEHRLFFPMASTEPIAVELDPRYLREDAPGENLFAPLPDELDTRQEIDDRQRAIVDEIWQGETTRMFRHRDLKLTSRGGETREQFEQRVRLAIDDGADQAVAALRDKVKGQVDRLEDKRDKLERRLGGLEDDARQRAGNELIGAAETVMSMFFGRRKSLSSAMTRRQQTSRANRRVEETRDDIADLQDEIDELAMDLESQIAGLRAEWIAKLADIEEQPVGLEKNDVRLTRLELVWVPVSRPI